jgi:uncharacterized protein (DUF427 family)
MTNPIRIRKAAGRWSIRSAGAVIGETTKALELSEGDYAPVIYIPRDDLAMPLLERSDKTTVCPHKGTAQYFHVVNRSDTIENAAWSYEDPIEAAAEIRDHIAFHTSDRIKVELT